ncbi:cytochrome b [Lysobacter hankyongensis]|uniref:Cytochrome b n=1 Tax=Lysobacter hankyongensis TaxID=1176535 RepID=A0ABP9BG63_9GAMM
MSLKNTADRWGGISQLLHWTIAILILVMAYLGLTMGDLPNGPDKIKTYALHKSIGITILALVALRLLWRLYAGTPRPVPGSPRWQERIASLTHAAIYLLLFAIPLSGWVLNSAAGFPLRWFGLVNLPHIVGESHDLHELAEEAHELMFWMLALLVVAHAGAAFYHHIFQRDATLARMLPRGWLRTDDATDPAPTPSSSGTPAE